MTREGQIEHEALNYGHENPYGHWNADAEYEEDCETPTDNFIAGAKWADAHPTDEVLKLRKMFESDPDAYKQGYKDAIDKVHKWLSEQMFELYDYGEIYVADGYASSLEEFLNNFDKAMEEQQ